MKRIFGILFILIAILSCNKDVINDTQRKNAENCMKAAMIEANNWLDSLNTIGYQIFRNHKYPSPFDKIMGEESNQEEIQKRINNMEQKFGRVEERNFFGVHVLLAGRILTYVPERMKNFRHVNPKKLGFNKIEDCYKNNIEGTYALLMYESKPTKKEKAEELLVMWRDKNEKWWLVDYWIADEI